MSLKLITKKKFIRRTLNLESVYQLQAKETMQFETSMNFDHCDTEKLNAKLFKVMKNRIGLLVNCICVLFLSTSEIEKSEVFSICR